MSANAWMSWPSQGEVRDGQRRHPTRSAPPTRLATASHARPTDESLRSADADGARSALKREFPDRHIPYTTVKAGLAQEARKAKSRVQTDRNGRYRIVS